jgi:hypothetical protein
MDKVAIRVSGENSFFDEVRTEAARLDRSPSWLLGHCISAILPKLASSLVVAAPKPAKMSAGAKRKVWTFFVPRDLVEHCGKLATRLGMSSDDVLAYAWLAGRDAIRAMPSS